MLKIDLENENEKKKASTFDMEILLSFTSHVSYILQGFQYAPYSLVSRKIMMHISYIVILIRLQVTSMHKQKAKPHTKERERRRNKVKIRYFVCDTFNKVLFSVLAI